MEMKQFFCSVGLGFSLLDVSNVFNIGGGDSL